MNMIAIDEEREHLLVWDLLPWIVNGTVSTVDRAQAESHMRECIRCRAELANQRTLLAGMDPGERTGPSVDRGFAALARRIDEAQRVPRERRSYPRVIRMSGARTGMLVYGLVALLLLETGALTIMGLRSGGESEPAYQTLSEATPPAHAAIRLVVDDTMTAGRLRELLASLKLQIVGGPGENGVYSLAARGGAGDVDKALDVLQATSGVRFAESATQ